MSIRQRIEIYDQETGRLIFSKQYLGNDETSPMGNVIYQDQTPEQSRAAIEKYASLSYTFTCCHCGASHIDECECPEEDQEHYYNLIWQPSVEEFMQDLISYQNAKIDYLMDVYDNDVNQAFKREFSKRWLTSRLTDGVPYMCTLELVQEDLKPYIIWHYIGKVPEREPEFVWGNKSGERYTVEITCG